MESTKIYKGLKSLKPELQKRLRLYLKSPYFNRSKTYQKAYDLLMTHLAKNNGKPLTKQVFWKKVFGNKPYKEINLRKLNSDLLRIFREFLAQEQFIRSEGRQTNYLMRAVHEWNIESLESVSIRRSDSYFEKNPYRNAQFYMERYIQEKELYQLIDFDKNREAKSNVEEILKNLDLFYLAEKLYFYSSSLVRSKIVSHDYRLLLIDEILEHLAHYDYENEPAVAIYYYLTLSLMDISNQKAYTTFRQLLEKHIHLFPKEEANQIYTGALNLAVARLNSGQYGHPAEYVDIIDEMIKKDILLEKDGYVSLNKFRNALISALRLEKFDWTENFVKEYGDKLHPEIRENAINYASALLHFRKGEFEKVVQPLAVIEYEDVAFGLAAKLLLAHAYYELDEFDVLESHIDAFMVFLSRRKDIPEARRQNYRRHLKYMRRLLRIIPGDKKAVENFLKDLQDDRNVMNKDLLLDKAKRLF